MSESDSIRLQYDSRGIDWEELAHLFKSAGLEGRSGQKILRAFDNSTIMCFALGEARLIGAGRALSDGEYHATIYDLAILPEYQNRGIGTAILRDLLSKLQVWRVLLIADEDVKPFYKKYGFANYPDLLARIDFGNLYDK